MKLTKLIAAVIFTLALFIYPNLSRSAVETCNSEGFANFESTGVPNMGVPFSALDPILFSGGGPFVDWETSQDLTSDTGSSGSVDYSSGCPCGIANASCMDSNCNPDSTELNTPTTALNTCGPDISAFGGIIDPNGDTDFLDNDGNDDGDCTMDGTDIDDFITFRLRVNNDPQAGTQAHFGSDVWQLVIDIEVIDSAFNVIRTFDGFNDFLVSVDGTFSSGVSGVDRMFVQFNNNGALCIVGDQCNTTGARTQDCEDIGTDCFIVDEFTACGEKLTGVPGCMADNLAENCNKSFSRTQTVANTFSCPSGSSQANEYYLDVMIPITAFVDQYGNRQIYCNTDIRTAISSSTTAQDTFLKDSVPDCTSDEECGYGITTPITLSSFQATSTKNEVLFEWTTSTETANAGFNLYSQDTNGRTKLNDTLIPTKVFDSLEPVKYSHSMKTKADTFYISDVDVNNKEEFHGPFEIGEIYGSEIKEEKLDWAKISSEHKAAKTSRQQAAIEKSKKNKANILNKTSGQSVNIESSPGVRILVENDGIQRVTFADISDAGLDLTGVPAESISLTNKGTAVPFYLDNSGGGAIEFIGESIDSLYTTENVYLLNTGAVNAPQIALDGSSVKNANNSLSEYTETLTIDNNRSYATTAANGDPWYDIFLIAFSGPASTVYNFELDNITDDKGFITVEVNGPGNIPNLNPDHHVTVSLNGVQIADELFEGFESKIINVDLKNSGASLINGTNKLIVTLPGDLNAPFDLVFIDKFSITYSRAPVALDNLLTFDAKANTIAVDGFDNPNITVYRDENGTISRIGSVDVTNTGGNYRAVFKGIPNTDSKYFAATNSALFTPVVEPANPFTDINSGIAEYLIISHPDFIAGLGSFVDARTNISNFNVKVVNSEDIYDQYNYGIFDPQAIKNYINYAINNMGTEYILLVGADTRDYKNFLNKNTISFIPTLYATSEAVIHFAPSDPLLADIDGDLVQDAAIGRFPVRTQADLASIISKTLNYPNAGHYKKALFAADSPDSTMSFSALSNFLIENLPADWQANTAYIEDLGVAEARAEITNSINSGVAYTSYFGHSDLNLWSFSNLFNNSDISALTNAGLPTVVSQYGCWNTYYVHEDSLSMAHKFLLEGDKGAAAVMGPSTRTSTTSDNTIGETIQRNLIEHQMPIGKAIMEAKQQHKNDFRNLRDVMVGWVLLGDPALELAD